MAKKSWLRGGKSSSDKVYAGRVGIFPPDKGKSYDFVVDVKVNLNALLLLMQQLKDGSIEHNDRGQVTLKGYLTQNDDDNVCLAGGALYIPGLDMEELAEMEPEVKRSSRSERGRRSSSSERGRRSRDDDEDEAPRRKKRRQVPDEWYDDIPY